MASSDSYFEFSPGFFEELERSEGVSDACKAPAARTLANAQASAPVDTGEYRDRLHLEQSPQPGRVTWRVVASDEKSLLIESKHGTLSRALKGAKQ